MMKVPNIYFSGWELSQIRIVRVGIVRVEIVRPPSSCMDGSQDDMLYNEFILKADNKNVDFDSDATELYDYDSDTTVFYDHYNDEY